LKSLGVHKGDRVTIYLPMIPEAAVAHARLRAHRRRPFRWCSVASRPIRWPVASQTAHRTSSSRPTKASAWPKIPLKANVDQALATPGTRRSSTCSS
jgi:acetyl-CoA synthetase